MAQCPPPQKKNAPLLRAEPLNPALPPCLASDVIRRRERRGVRTGPGSCWIVSRTEQPYSRVNNGVFQSNDGNILNPIGTAAVRRDSSVGEFFARCIPFLVGRRCVVFTAVSVASVPWLDYGRSTHLIDCRVHSTKHYGSLQRQGKCTSKRINPASLLRNAASLECNALKKGGLHYD